MTIQPASRLAVLPPYFFNTWAAKIRELQANGHNVIRLDMGSPDMPPSEPTLNTMLEAARQPDTHGYQPYGSPLSYRRAWTDYYQQRYEVQLDPATQAEGLIGSKEGLFHLAQAMVDPGDVVLVPDPSYSVYERGARFAGGEVVLMPLRAENRFLPDLDAIPEDVARRAKLLWLNYPNNPTAAVAPLEFFERVVAFARRYNILVCHDAPYMEVTHDRYRAPSLLQVSGATDVAVELNSMSKTWNMAGWRLGIALGNETAIAALHRMKSNVDSSHFLPILQGGIQALQLDEDWLAERNAIYTVRRDLVLAAVNRLGLKADTPKASLYVWAALPAGYDVALDYTTRLLEDTGVSVTAGTAFGACGEGYVRIALGMATERIEEALDRWARWAESHH